MMRYSLSSHARRAHGPLLAVALLLVQPRPAFADIVRGFVTDEQGKPVFNADFNVYDAATGVKLPPSDKTDATGKYRLLVDPGRYDLLCRPVIGQVGPSGQVLAPRIARDVPVNGTLDLNFTLPVAARVLGRVTDAANADPNTNGVYPCDLDFDRSDDGSRQPSQGNVTSPFGTFVAYVEGGSYSVTATPIDSTLAPARIYDWVVPTTEILQMPLVPAIHLAGTIRDTNGAPIEGCVLKFDVPSGRRQPASKHLSDANGFYRLGLLPGVYRITVEPPLNGRYAAIRDPDVDLTSTQLRNFTLPFGAAVTGTVSDKSGRPVVNAKWTVTLQDSVAIVATPNSSSGFDGRYRMVLVPALYRLRLTPPASSGLDSVVIPNVAIRRDTTIDVDYAIGSGGGSGSSPVIRFAPRGNPTHTRAAVSLVLNRPVASAQLEVYDVAGRRARVIFSGPLGIGTHTLPWDGRRENGAQAHTGVYLVRARLDGHEQVTRFVLLP